jgi:hypothetical protein
MHLVVLSEFKIDLKKRLRDKYKAQELILMPTYLKTTLVSNVTSAAKQDRK